MPRRTLLENIAREVMQTGLYSHGGRCRDTAKAIVGRVRETPQLVHCKRSVLTIFYLANDAIWDHTVVAINLPWLHVVEARMNYLAMESSDDGNVPIGISVFVGTLTGWQTQVERLTGGTIVDFKWTQTVPEDGSVQMDLLTVEHQRMNGGVRRIALGYHKPASANKTVG